MKTLKSILNSSITRRHNSDLPNETVVEDGKKGAAAAKPKKDKKAPAKKDKKAPAKKDKKAPAAKPAKKEKKAKVAKAPKEKTERKPRVEGRIDLVYRSGPERAIALALGEKHHAGEAIKVDNCTAGFKVGGKKAEDLRGEYESLRTEWRKAQDELTEKFLAKAAKK